MTEDLKKNADDLEAQAAAGAIVFKGKVLLTAIEIKEAAKGAKQSELADLAKALERAGIEDGAKFLKAIGVSYQEAQEAPAPRFDRDDG